MKPESKLRTQIVIEIKSIYQDAFVFHAHGSAYTPVGVPDLVMCINGMFFGLEVKFPDKPTPSPAQLFIGKQIDKAGGQWACVTSPEEALDFVQKALPKN